MAKREAPKTCPKCGGDRLACRTGSFGRDGGAETVRGHIVCLDCRESWTVEQVVGRMLGSNEEPQGVEPSPLDCYYPDGEPKAMDIDGYSENLPVSFCYECESGNLEGWGSVAEGLLTIAAVCRSCGCSRVSGRYYLGRPRLVC